MKIIVTTGDCNGIGIEVFLKALQGARTGSAQICLAGNRQSLSEYLELCRMDALVDSAGLHIAGRTIELVDCGEYAPVRFGAETSEAGALAFAALRYAAGELLSGAAHAVVTLPVSKHALHQAGFTYPGQTEFFAHSWGIHEPLMILATGTLRVALATIHMPLRQVPSALTAELLTERILSLKRSLRQDFGVPRPRIAVLGLNPHAGEQGLIGTEEHELIGPLLKSLAGGAYSLAGPFPADGFFAHGSYNDYDGILAMYHDQGLIPLKLIAGGGGVNFSAGLPFVRTSPDHGTAFAIAGKNLADGRSTREALEMAVAIAGRRTNSGIPAGEAE